MLTQRPKKVNLIMLDFLALFNKISMFFIHPDCLRYLFDQFSAFLFIPFAGHPFREVDPQHLVFCGHIHIQPQ